MPYIGRAATNTGSVRYLDNIASGFDGSDTTFTAQVGGVSITPDQENVRIYLDGVFQHPGSGNAYTISGSTITFTEAPVANTVFTGYVVGAGAYLDDKAVSSAKLDDDAVTAAKLDDDGTGFQVGDLGVGGSLTSGDKLTVTGRARVSGGIIGDLTGDVTGDVTGNTSGTAAVATTVTITDNESTNEDNAVIFTAGGDVDGGNLGLESDGNLTYNPSTGKLTATQLAGTLQTAAQTNITSVGTIGTGVWQGTAIASAYLDADTAHLTTTQTFTGTKTFQSEHTYLENTGGNCNLFIKSSNSGNARLYLGDVADAGVGFIDYDHGTSMTIGAGGAVGLTLAESDNTATFAGKVICNKHMAVGAETAISNWEDTTNEWGALHLGNGGSVFGAGSDTTNSQAYIATNVYYDGGWKRIGAGEASFINLNDDGHIFFQHASTSAGTNSADGAITFSQSLKLGVDGNAIFNGSVRAGGDGATFGVVGIEGAGGDATLDLFSDVGSGTRGKAEIFFTTDSSSDHVSCASIVMEQPPNDEAARKGQIIFKVSDNSGPTQAMIIENNLNTTFAGSVDVNGYTALGNTSIDTTYELLVGNIGNNANVKIKATSDSARLYLDAEDTSGETSDIWFQAGGSTEAGIRGDNSGNLRFTSGGTTERMRLSGGSLLLGTTSNSTQWEDSSGDGSLYYHQHTAGSRNTGIAISSDTSVGYAMFYINAIDGANDERFMAFYRNNTQIGTISLSNTTNVSYDTSSDYRLKENIEPMTGSIARLKQIKPSTFNFISEPDVSCEGFIAHELGEVVPNAVSGKKDAMRDDGKEIMPQGVDFGRVVPLLVSALQEAIERIEVLENA